MSRIDKVFAEKGQTALIAYITSGYPSIDATLKAVPVLAESGCDIIELGIPFSDPLADGVTIQNASYHALQNGITPEICLELADDLSKKVDTPLVFMSYYNPIYHYGTEKFCKDCAASGVDGLIIPDLPPEEGTEIEGSSLNNGIDLIYLLAPTSDVERIRVGAEHSRGFIYLVSVTGVTGARNFLPSGLKDFVTSVRNVTDKPLCVGFGISTPEQASQVGSLADGVIVGSKIVQLLESDDSFSRIGTFISNLRRALDS
ncbi:MAG: tryptophan synthase subunit alpha [Dehalococcoidales bacterium]|nr:MAG: tryptophan synthase subunit alpha [Dehalococcoidales bacterium]